MAVASLLDYHGNPVRRKGLIKIRANGTRSGIAEETLGKALSRSSPPPLPPPPEFIGGPRGEPAGPLRGTLALSPPPPPFLATGTRGLRLRAELSPIFIERSSFMADRVDVRPGGRGRGGGGTFFDLFSPLVCVSMMMIVFFRRTF